MTWSFGLLFIVSLYCPIAVMWGSLKYRERRAKRFGLKHPLGNDLLRPAGHSLSLKIDDLRFDLLGTLLGGVFAGSFSFLIYLAMAKIFPKAEIIAVGLAVLCWVVTQYHVARQILQLLPKIRNLRLGWHGELASAEELNRLMHDGYHVFHDLPADGFNIDHVVVGANGVFAIETKTRVKKKNGTSKDAHILKYDGKSLSFAGRPETKPLEQAKRQAAWLSKWLSAKTGEHVPVIPGLTVPGWYVELVGMGDVVVFQPKQSKMAIAKSRRGTALLEAQIKRVAFALDERCRGVEINSHQI